METQKSVSVPFPFSPYATLRDLPLQPLLLFLWEETIGNKENGTLGIFDYDKRLGGT